MRIGFDAKRFFENKTGLGSFSRNLISALVKEHPQNEYILYSPQKPSKEHITKYLDTSNIKIRYPKKSFGHYWRTRGILKDLENDKIEIYHGLSNELPFGIHKTNLKTIVTIHDLLFRQFPQDHKPVDRMIYDWKSKYACSKANTIVAISQATQVSISEEYKIKKSNISVIHQDIDPIFYQERSKGHQKIVLEKLGIYCDYILFVGNDSVHKNLLTLLKSYSHSRKKRDLVLVLNKLGLNRECENLIEKENLNNRIKRLVDIPMEYLPALYTKAKCLIYPSLGEGWGLPVEEAIACGTRVIVPDFIPFTERFSALKIFLNDAKDPIKMAEQIDAVCAIKQNISKESNVTSTSASEYHKLYEDLQMAAKV